MSIIAVDSGVVAPVLEVMKVAVAQGGLQGLSEVNIENRVHVRKVLLYQNRLSIIDA